MTIVIVAAFAVVGSLLIAVGGRLGRRAFAVACIPHVLALAWLVPRLADIIDDVLARMHALAKGSTLGLVLLLAGAAISLHDPNDITSLVLAAVIQVLASPPASNLLSRSTYLAEHIPTRVDVVDEGGRANDAD